MMTAGRPFTVTTQSQLPAVVKFHKFYRKVILWKHRYFIGKINALRTLLCRLNASEAIARVVIPKTC